MRYSEGLFGRKEPPRGAAAPASPAPHSPAHAPLAAVPRAGSPPTPPAPAEAAHRADEGSGSRLIVGPNIKLKGVEIDDCDTLVVEGRVEATMVSRAIQIAEHGAFKGSADIEVAEIRGSFEGELTVRGRLVVHATGRVAGKVRYGKLLVQEGGEITGEVGTLAGRAAPGAA
ncbi:MAG: polymer-forming cytoskeletal protein [Burkholderiales bacterium]|nr:polymer-forming cytoskeletal protein [Burkholderiales bacterium]MBX3715268.1 polymer-forming cytoskeletal protein [Burkholderiales bacterium]